MAFAMKPTRPGGSGPVNPRTHKIAGFDALLKELATNNIGTTVGSAQKEQPNSARHAEKRHHYIEPLPGASTRGPSTARTGPAASASSATNSAPVAEAQAAKFLTPDEAVSKFSAALSPFEREEIAGFKEIYYVGEGARKNVSSRGSNNGFDDDKGDYKVVLDDHIGYRYQVVGELGRGSFGQVSKAIDHKSKKFVALKIIKNKKKFHDQALIEVNILKHLRDNDPSDRMNIVRMLHHFIFRNHMVIIFEIHGMNLYELCKANRFAPLSLPSIKHFAKQLLVSLQYCYRHRIVHCDLKPENLLLRRDSKSAVKVIDFGSSCFEHQKLYTYIQSRFYRAPEIILGIPYTTAIDMWSFGCILAELANGYPIFPGESETEQLACIMEFLGAPPRALVDRSPRKRNFFDTNGTPRLAPNSRGRIRRPSTKDLGAFLRSAAKAEDGNEFVDFVQHCLTWVPEKRWTPQEAMRHPWVRNEFEHPGAAERDQQSSVATPASSSHAPPSGAQTSRAAVGVSAVVPHPPSYPIASARGDGKLALPKLVGRR